MLVEAKAKGVKRKIGMHGEIKEREEKSHDDSKYILRLKVEGKYFMMEDYCLLSAADNRILYYYYQGGYNDLRRSDCQLCQCANV